MIKDVIERNRDLYSRGREAIVKLSDYQKFLTTSPITTKELIHGRLICRDNPQDRFNQ
jgi:hypothetical protein